MNHNYRKSISAEFPVRFLSIFIFVFFFVSTVFAIDNKKDLSGVWTVKLDSGDIGISQKWYLTTFSDQIHLPGTTDDAQMGIPDTLKPELKRPQVSFSFNP